MKKYLFKYFSILFLLLSISVLSQNKEEKKQIIKNYKLSELRVLKEKYTETYYSEKKKAFAVASQKGWKVNYIDAKGSYYELMRVSEEGKPLYYKTLNVAAAESTRFRVKYRRPRDDCTYLGRRNRQGYAPRI
jgi:hypothetical protein